MNQRVNLQYSIDIDELPTEARRLFLSAHKFLVDSVETLRGFDESGTSILSVDGLKTIDDIRTSMMKADYVFADIQNIIKGYLNHISSENTEQDEATGDIMANELFQQPDLTELEEKLKLFQSNFEDENDTTSSQELSD